MARKSNLDKAFERIEERAATYSGDLTKSVYNELFKDAVTEFNLDDEKSFQLMSKQFTLPVKELAKLTVSDKVAAEFDIETFVNFDVDAKANLTGSGENSLVSPVTSIIKEDKPSETYSTEYQQLLLRVINLESALIKGISLAGYGNYLREFNLEPWKPGKKDLNKNYG